MTGTDFCVNKCKQSRSYLNQLVLLKHYFISVFNIFNLHYKISIIRNSKTLQPLEGSSSEGTADTSQQQDRQNESTGSKLYIWWYLTSITLINCGPGSSVGIATSYGLDALGIESRWEERFFATVQTGPGAHPASCTLGTGSFPGVKYDRDVTLTPHPLLVPWS